MLVLHVNESPPGGVVNYLKVLTQEQVRRGHDVHLLAPVSCHTMPGVTAHPWSLRRARPSTYLPAIAQYLRTARSVQPDVIHLHSFWAGQFGRVPGLTGLVAAPLVYQPHAWTMDLYDGAWFRRLVWLLERRASSVTAEMVANCWDEIHEGHRGGVGTPGRAIGVPLDTTRFAPVDPETRRRHRAELGLGERNVILCLGRVARQKGQDQLVAAWERDPIPDTELVLVGVGDTAPLRACAPTQWGTSVRSVHNQVDVRPWIHACDILVQPSRYETVGLAVAEAMSCGRPVVATRANGVAETVGEDPAVAGGAVVELGDMAAMLYECRRRLADPGRWAEESGRARRRAEEQFAPARVSDRLDAAYSAARQLIGVR